MNEDRPDEATPVQPASVALVPIGQIERRARRRWYRWAPNPIFVAHLIAEALQVPQARRIRRASMVDAEAAYRTRQAPTPGTGSHLRQII